jgi:hypothetical protein
MNKEQPCNIELFIACGVYLRISVMPAAPNS